MSWLDTKKILVWLYLNCVKLSRAGGLGGAAAQMRLNVDVCLPRSMFTSTYGTESHAVTAIPCAVMCLLLTQVKMTDSSKRDKKGLWNPKKGKK